MNGKRLILLDDTLKNLVSSTEKKKASRFDKDLYNAFYQYSIMYRNLTSQ